MIKKYNLDSCKFLFRQIKSFNNLYNSTISWHVGNISKIVYEPKNVRALNVKIFRYCGSIWNRLVRANIYKSIIFA